MGKDSWPRPEIAMLIALIGQDKKRDNSKCRSIDRSSWNQIRFITDVDFCSLPPFPNPADPSLPPCSACLLCFGNNKCQIRIQLDYGRTRNWRKRQSKTAKLRLRESGWCVTRETRIRMQTQDLPLPPYRTYEIRDVHKDRLKEWPIPRLCDSAYGLYLAAEVHTT